MRRPRAMRGVKPFLWRNRQSFEGLRTVFSGSAIVGLVALSLSLQTPLFAQKRAIEVGGFQKTGKIQHAMIDESSGLTPSTRYRNCYWTHNDNGPNPGLFLMNVAGQLMGIVELPQIEFRDWEDLASFSYRGKDYLLLADVGDNLARHRSGRLYIFPEPDFGEELSPKKQSTMQLNSDIHVIEFSYPDGARDCEAVMVDVEQQEIFLVSKVKGEKDQHEVSSFYSVPLVFSTTFQPVVARRLKSPFQKPLITGAQISPDQSLAVIRSYSTAWVFRRRDGETWETVFRRGQPEKRVVLPLQRQGEAICFTPNGRSLLITSEGLEQRIWKIDLKIPQIDR